MRRFAVPSAVVAIVAVALTGATALATHEPANKVAASGSANELVFVNNGDRQLLLTEQIKTSKPTDLILNVTSECGIYTRVATVGNQSSTAAGQLKYVVEIDGTPVPIAAPDPDNGRVVFCNRAHQQTTTDFDDNDARLEQFLRTRSANGFNWMALNVGSGIHTIKVFAEYNNDTVEGLTAAGDSEAQGVVGNRTLIIEPVKAANDEAVTAVAG